MKHFRSFVRWVVLIALMSCSSQEDFDPVNSDHEYFPLRKGFYQLYDVEEVRYTLGVPETLRYELKVAVIDSFRNGTGNEYTYVLQRSRRIGNSSWEQLETWSAERRSREAVVTHGTVPYVVISFPAEQNRQWNGNAYNTEENPVSGETSDLYTITETGKNVVVNGSSYADCITVLQEDNQEFIVYFDQRTEVYARHVGLISRTTTQLRYCNDQDRNCIGEQIVDEGLIYHQTITGYGIE